MRIYGVIPEIVFRSQLQFWGCYYNLHEPEAKPTKIKLLVQIPDTLGSKIKKLFSFSIRCQKYNF